MRTLALTGLLSLVFAGCTSIDARDPLPPRIGASELAVTAHVQSAYTPTEPGVSNSPGRYSPALDIPAIEGRVNALLRERATGASSATPLATLEASVTRADIKYEGQTGIFALKLFFTIFFFPVDFPNYFIASDRFALVLQSKWKLTEKGQIIAEGTAEGKQRGRFGDLSRGWYFVGYLRMPSPLNAEEFQEMSDALRPGAQDALAESLVLEVEKALVERKTR